MVLAALGLLGSSSAMAASPARVHLQYRLQYQRGAGAERCPDEASLRAAVAGRLGYDPFVDSAAETANVAIAGEGDGLSATIHLAGVAGKSLGSRELHSRANDCAALSDALTFALSIAIDPVAMSAPHPAPAPPPAQIVMVVTPPPPVPPPRLEEPKPVGPRIQPSVSLGTFAAWGSAPLTSFGGELQLALRRGPYALALEGRAEVPRTLAFQGGEVESASLGGDLVPCFVHGLFAGCGLVEAGVRTSSAKDVPHARYVTTPDVAAGARAEVAFPLARMLALRLHGDLLATIVATTVRIGETEVWTTPALRGKMALDLAWIFP